MSVPWPFREKALGPAAAATTLNNRAGLLSKWSSASLTGLDNTILHFPIVCTYVLQGKYDEADRLLLRVIEIDEKTLGRAHPDLATALNNRALLLKKQVRAVRNLPEFSLVQRQSCRCSTTRWGCWRIR